MWLHRTMCDVFESMKQCHKTHCYGHLPGLIEEARVMAERMEAGLEYQKEYNEYHDEARKLEKQVKSLKKEVTELEETKSKIRDEITTMRPD